MEEWWVIAYNFVLDLSCVYVLNLSHPGLILHDCMCIIGASKANLYIVINIAILAVCSLCVSWIDTIFAFRTRDPLPIFYYCACACNKLVHTAQTGHKDS